MAIVDGINYPETYRSGPQLLNEAELNYQAARNYFVQKKIAMIKAIANKTKIDTVQVENGLVNSMNNLITNAWNKINEAVLNNVKIYGGQAARYKIKDNADWTNIPQNLVDRIKNGVDNNGNIYSILGFYYEEYLEANIANTAYMVASSNINQILSEFLTQFSQTGALKSKSSIRGDGLSIRPDLAMGLGKETAEDGILYDKTGKLAAELQTTFNIQNYREAHNLNTVSAIEQDSNILKEYLDSGMFGFSVKRWTEGVGSQGKPLTSASGLKNIINQEFAKSEGRTWNATYAYRTMVNIVSQYLLDILGPVNVAFVTGKSFEWTCDFLVEALLTMNIYSKKIYKNYEVQPYIQSGNIYVQNYKRGRAQAMQQISFAKGIDMSGKNWNAYQLRFTIHEK